MERSVCGREGCQDDSANLQFGDNPSRNGNDRMIITGDHVTLSTDHGQMGVGYILYTEVFASDSKTRYFNRVVDRIRADPQALELLGSDQTIRAFGEPTMSKWSRNRPIVSTMRTDPTGIEHFHMHFNVEGSANSGIATIHMVKAPGSSDWQYRLLALDVKGHPRYHLENADKSSQGKKKPGFKMLGVQWR